MNQKISSWDPIWENVYKDNIWGKYPGESLIQFVARNYYNKIRPNVKILEVGCGPGANIWFLAKENFLAYGIDGSQTAIQQASQRLYSENLKADLRVGDVIELPYDDSYFDSILDIECIYANNIDNTMKILEEINRVLKKDGLFYSRTLSDKIYIGDNYTKVDYKSYKDISDGPLAEKGFARLMNETDIIKLYGKYFEIVSIDTLDYTKDNGKININEFIIIARKK
jgi:ubiquinone/menaquinone biosynthesis C-methylase UbiE